MDRESEASGRGAIRRGRGGELRVALVYPNAYRVGMANLGVHAVYRLVNGAPFARCERAFLPDGGGEPRSVESGDPLREFDAVAFSLSFEEDYPHVLAILDRAGLPLRAADRGERHPLVLAGGIAVQLNPEPLAPFFDAFFVGEAEILVPPLVASLRDSTDARAPRPERLRALSLLPGAYVPSLYEVEYADTRSPRGEWVTRFEPRGGAPARVRRQWLPSLRGVATSRAVDSPDAEFGDLHLTEVARGCLWGCRFCAAGFVQRPYREVDLATLRAEASAGMARGLRIGLVGPDASDHGGLDSLTRFIAERGGAFSPSSLRVDAIGTELSRRMAAGGERSVTIAPEAGTERMRRVVNKGFSDDDVVRAAESALSQGMRNVKMYFMCGLPTEREDDVLGIARLALRVREEALLPHARRRGRAGRLSLSVNPFVPKPWTPFQWAGMDDVRSLAAKRALLVRALRPRGVEVDFMSPRAAFLQALLSRGDRRCADLLEAAHRGGGLRRALRGWPHDPDFFVRREADVAERLPWDFLDHGLAKRYLAREWRRSAGAKLTPRCAVETCRACGLGCADRPELARRATGGG